jgi:hypothetical protein
MPLSSRQKLVVVVVDGITDPVGDGVPVTDVSDVIKVDGVALLVVSVVGG